MNELLDELQKDQLFFEESEGGVTFSGGEPLYQPKALRELLAGCKKINLHTVVDTCGHAPWATIERIMPLTDLFLYDLKLVDREMHRKYTGVGNELIFENLQKLIAAGASVELRIPLIPGVNTLPIDLENFISVIEQYKNQIKKVHLLPYHHTAENKYKKLNLVDRMDAVKSDQKVNIDNLQRELVQLGYDVSIGG